MLGELIMSRCTFRHQEIHTLATQAFLKPFLDESVCLCFLSFVEEICFAGYSVGLFRVRWSRFDAVSGRGCPLITVYEFKNQN